MNSSATVSTPVDERLYCLMEECAEAIQMAAKSGRHGLDSTHPHYGLVLNRVNLGREIGQILAIIDVLRRVGDIDKEDIREGRLEKLNKLTQYLHHVENKRLVREELAEWSA